MKCRNKTCYWYNDTANLNCIKLCVIHKADEAKRKVIRECIRSLQSATTVGELYDMKKLVLPKLKGVLR